VTLPLVSLCTVTRNRAAFLPLLQGLILLQTYPRERMEWVIVDDSDPDHPRFQPDPSQGLAIQHHHLPGPLPLGRKRNLAHSLCRGEIIVVLDDDDYYPHTRVAHAVEQLQASEALIAGSSLLPVFFLPERELWLAGPYGPRHATANTFAFKRELLQRTRCDDAASQAEEKAFLQGYSLPMVQLQAPHTIVCIGHDRNTYEKRQLQAGGANPRFRRVSRLRDDQIAVLLRIAAAYGPLLTSVRSACAHL
jgi:glycosyltransferase involved in cell wall biosynthesis